jgi:hypothetical protein
MAKRQRRRQLTDAASCPRFKIHEYEHRSITGGVLAVDFEMTVGVRQIGLLQTKTSGSALEVESIAIEDAKFRRCGLGTKLYEAAAKWGCANGMKLTSDVLRTTDSQGFWEKQVKKGRARCMVGASQKASTQDTDGPRMGRGGCGMYQLISCSSTDLSRRRRRKK